MRRTAIIAAVLMLLTLAAAAYSPVTVVNALAPADTYLVTSGLAYGPGPRNGLDVYTPQHSAEMKTPQSPRSGYPVVVFFYGGSWNRGERADYKFIGEALASKGIVVAIADYRLYPEVHFPEFLKDCAKAVAWVKHNASRYGGDPDRVFVMGHSAGGYNASMIALDPRWLAAEGMSPSILSGWIGLSGPYDFLPMKDPDARPVFYHPDYPPGTQPIDYVSKASPPAFLGAASVDDLVNPVRSSKQMAEKLRALGVPATLKLYDDVSHVTIAGAFARPLRGLAPVREDVAAFVLAQR